MTKIEELDLATDRYSADVARLYAFEGWHKKSDGLKPVTAALKNSYCAYAAYDGEKMIGFFRALSDGVSDAYLVDLVVDPEYRRRGVASALTNTLVKRLKTEGVEWITAISTPAAKSMYLKIGDAMPGHVPVRF